MARYRSARSIAYRYMYGKPRYRKKRYKKRWKKRGINYNPAPKKSLLGERRVVKLKYNDLFIATIPGLGVPAVLSFRANGLTPVQVPTLGHQPRGFDQLGALWNHYTVIGAKMTVMWCPTPDLEPVSNPGQPLVFQPNYETICGQISLRAAQPQFAPVANTVRRNKEYRDNVFGYVSQGSTPCLRLSKSFSAKKFFTKPDILDNAELQGNTRGGGAGDNPEEGAFFVILTSNADMQQATTARIALDVFIEYIVVFHEPRQPPSSNQV